MPLRGESSIAANPADTRCAFSFPTNLSPLLLLLMGCALGEGDGVGDGAEMLCVEVDDSMLP